jgi:hypothetical protein
VQSCPPTLNELTNAYAGCSLIWKSRDATILQFDLPFQIEAIRAGAFRPPAHWANRGQMSRVVLSILRQADEPLTSRDIALELLVSRAMDRRGISGCYG